MLNQIYLNYIQKCLINFISWKYKLWPLITILSYGLPWWLSGKGSSYNAGGQELQIRLLGWEDLLEEGMVTHSNILAWRIPWTEEPGRLQSIGWHTVGHNFSEGNGTPLQYSCLENPMDRGAWWATVHRVAKSRTRLSSFTFTFHFHALEKEMAAHSSILAWRIPGTGEPGGLPSMGSHRVGYDWSDLAEATWHAHMILFL